VFKDSDTIVPILIQYQYVSGAKSKNIVQFSVRTSISVLDLAYFTGGQLADCGPHVARRSIQEKTSNLMF